MCTTHWLHKLNNTQINNAKDLDIVMPMYNIIEYNLNYSKTWGCLWQYCRDDPNDNAVQSELFKFKINIAGKTFVDDNNTNVEIAVPLKYVKLLSAIFLTNFYFSPNGNLSKTVKDVFYFI